MQLPDKADPRWRDFVTGPRKYPLESLAARMLVTRLRLRTMRGDESVVRASIDAAWEFFERNEATTQADVAAIFGGEVR
jgi:hypothetical protein